jgi:hypothetical protein
MKNETTLSPAAQAVLDALIDGRAEAAVGPQKRITWWNDRVGLAAAFRAAANEIAPIENVIIDNCWFEKSNPVREQLLALADELEG